MLRRLVKLDCEEKKWRRNPLGLRKVLGWERSSIFLVSWWTNRDSNVRKKGRRGKHFWMGNPWKEIILLFLSRFNNTVYFLHFYRGFLTSLPNLGWSDFCLALVGWFLFSWSACGLALGGLCNTNAGIFLCSLSIVVTWVLPFTLQLIGFVYGLGYPLYLLFNILLSYQKKNQSGSISVMAKCSLYRKSSQAYPSQSDSWDT